MKSAKEMLRALLESGYTQRELGAKVGMPQDKVSRWLTGGPPPAADQALRLRELYVSRARRTSVGRTRQALDASSVAKEG